jgi:lipopolysaccharide/colanic/teichoic acid biosynthesis glycosyltransferase
MPEWVYHVSKRGLDILVAGTALVLLSPVLLLTLWLVRRQMGSPVLFRHSRAGQHGVPFDVLKIRTMRPPRPGEDLYASDADRLTPLGNRIRSWSLDELPQLLNVLKGQMSLVGPRPPIPYEVQEYSKWHTGRFDCLPGMTGLWQVSGKNNLTFQEMVRLDIQYARKMSLLLDLKILLKTPFAIMKEVFQFLKKGQTKD